MTAENQSALIPSPWKLPGAPTITSSGWSEMIPSMPRIEPCWVVQLSSKTMPQASSMLRRWVAPSAR